MESSFDFQTDERNSNVLARETQIDGLGIDDLPNISTLNYCDNMSLQENEKFQNGIVAEDLGSLLQMFEEAAESMLVTSLNSTDLLDNESNIQSSIEDICELKLKCGLIEDQLNLNVKAESETEKIMRDLNEKEQNTSNNKELNNDKYFNGPSSPFVDGPSSPSVDEPSTPSVDFSCGPTFENKKSTDESSCESSTDDQSSDDHGYLSPPYNTGRGQCGYLSRCLNQGGPRRQQGRGRKKQEDQVYDKLPSYYTVFSRPHRTATGLVRNSSVSSVKLVTKSGIPDRDRDPSPDRTDLVLDKVPSYQSCFTNSTKYDEDMVGAWKDDDDDEYLVHSPRRRCGRIRSRSRSRSRGLARSRCGNRFKSGWRGRKSCSKEKGSSPSSYSGAEQLPNTAEVPLQKICKTKLEPRRILYVGRIPAECTSAELKEKFERFGQVSDCTVHFRESGDNYGFVTFARPDDAFHAVENGRFVRGCENFDICFGGRRRFCKADYTDLDGNVQMEDDLIPVTCKSNNKDNFDQLLQQALKNKK